MDKRKKRLIVIGIISLILTFAAYEAGYIINSNTEIDPLPAYIVALASLVFIILSAILNFLLVRINKNKFKKMRVTQIYDLLDSMREKSEAEAKRQRIKIKCLFVLTGIYDIVLILAALGMMFCFGLCPPNILYMATGIVSVAVLDAVLCTIPGRNTFDPGPDFPALPREDYPYLYSLAEKAARSVGVNEKNIILAVQTVNNIGISRFANAILLILRLEQLEILSEPELYSAFLHEFAHVKFDRFGYRLQIVNNWIDSVDLKVQWNVKLLYQYPIILFIIRYMLYSFVSDIAGEFKADQAMLNGSGKEAAGSALVKITYLDHYEWEDCVADFYNIFAAESPDERQFGTERTERFLASVRENKERWDSYIRKEIISRSATHPLCRMRLEALGLTEYRSIDFDSAPEYTQELKRVLSKMDELLLAHYKENYEQQRDENYLKPLKTVQDWEVQGKPVTAHEFGDVLDALNTLGRISEGEALCDRAIAELPEVGAARAYYWKAFLLLHRYDKAGIDLAYKAIDINDNYIHLLDTLAQYCLVTGDQEELTRYREYAAIQAQKKQDEISSADELKPSDKLSTDRDLPDEIRGNILEFIRSVDNGKIECVYLVRKVISEEEKCSVFVVKFKPEIKPDDRYDVLHSMFMYLDTCADWSFSLFEYDSVRNVHVENIPLSAVYPGERLS